jgi:HD-GYP domain-containing protein (c-di-GMP phosphodiesterase class II)
MSQLDSKKWIPVRKSNLKYYDDVELFYKNPAGKIMLYKPAGMSFTDKSLEAKPYLGTLYIRPDDKIRALRSAQRGFSTELTDRVMKGTLKDLAEIKRDLAIIVDETLSEPRSGHLQVVPGFVSTIVDGYAGQPELIKYLARISNTDYSTAIHSINVMALTIGYCFYTKRSVDQTRELGITALLHDVGKLEIDPYILTAPRRLTEEEFKEIEKHPIIGADILGGYGGSFGMAIPGTLQHHLRNDGTGYPDSLRGRTISEAGKLLAIIDSYEVMTNDDRPYRSSMRPIQALSLLKKDVDSGLYDRKIFEAFAYSLVDSSSHRAKPMIAKASSVRHAEVAEIAGTLK